MSVYYTQWRTETVIYSPLKSRPTFTSGENVLKTSCYFYLPRIFYEWTTWLLWNAASRDAKLVVKLTYFRYDRLRSTKTHIIIMANMKTGMICHIRGSNDECRVIGTRFDGLVFRIEDPKKQSTKRHSVNIRFHDWIF